jgi:hypothetical protein
LNDTVEGMKRKPLLAGAILAAAALAACSSTQDVLDPSAITAPDQDSATASTTVGAALPGSAAEAGAPAQTAAASQPSAALASNARIQFAPIVGTSVEAAASLSEQLASRARERGIRITGAADTGATHLLKGYFTPLAEGRQTTIIYVWDVYDPSGNRVHRISGQQKAVSAGGEGWASVPPSAMRAVADSTIDQVAAWLAVRGG